MREAHRRDRRLRFAIDEGWEAVGIVEGAAAYHGFHGPRIVGMHVVDQSPDGKGVDILAFFTQRALATSFTNPKLHAGQAYLPGGGLDDAPLHDAVAVVLEVLENPHGQVFIDHDLDLGECNVAHYIVRRTNGNGRSMAIP